MDRPCIDRPCIAICGTRLPLPAPPPVAPPSPHPRFTSQELGTILELRPLPKPLLASYVFELLSLPPFNFEGRRENVPDALTRCLHERVAKWPKWVSEMLHAMQSSGKLRLEAGGTAVVCAPIEELMAVPFPASLKATLLRLFESLPTRLQRVLQLASPLEAFSEDMLQVRR